MIRRIVTAPRGSWKYQDAFRVATYKPRRTKAGRLIWHSVWRSGKYSAPQLRRMGWGGGSKGSLHNRPVTEAEQAFLPGFPLLADPG